MLSETLRLADCLSASRQQMCGFLYISVISLSYGLGVVALLDLIIQTIGVYMYMLGLVGTRIGETEASWYTYRGDRG